ncbi:MAG: adenylate kinase [Tannerella sp.]|jgi:adenylate kinase|nr:adenylate kinase [Tannerella sp.]
MLNIVIFGAPGSGKGTQSKLMIEKYGLDYISTGNVLREAITAGSELGKLANSYMNEGKLVPDDLIIQLISDFLDGMSDSRGVIFDGFPRTIPQAKALKELLNRRGTDVSIMLDLQVDDDELTRRMLERGRISGRTDDKPETIQQRLNVYHTQTAPLATYYISEDRRVAIKGTGSIDDIFRRIDGAVANLLKP